MNQTIALIATAVLGYLLGNFQTGVLVSRALGKFDIRSRGSMSAGATNMLRTMGWMPSALTLLGDLLKGLIATLIGMHLGGLWGARLGGLCAVLGHNWPVFFGFKGGKGIATSAGVILVLDPFIGLSLMLCQALVLKFTRIMSVASMVSAGLYVVLTLSFHWGDWWTVGYAAVIGALAFFSHRGNIERLTQNRENKLDFEEINRISNHFHKKQQTEEE